MKDPSQIHVLVACEESQRVCIAFRQRGFDAYSCDLLPCSGGHPEWHILGDALEAMSSRHWDLIIAHPPCTYLSNAGACRMYPQKGILDPVRYSKALCGKSFFMKFFYSSCPHVAIENPTPLKIIQLPKPSQVIQPYQFGHPYSKRTLLWLKDLPLLEPTLLVSDYVPFLPSNTSAFSKGCGGSKGVVRGSMNYSKTFPGIAHAMATQWGDFLLLNS